MTTTGFNFASMPNNWQDSISLNSGFDYNSILPDMNKFNLSPDTLGLTNNNNNPFNFKSFLFGDGQKGGALIPMTQLLGMGFNAWNGMQQLDLQKEMFDFKKDAWNQQFATQKKLVNNQIADRGASRGTFLNDPSYKEDYVANHSI